MFICLLLLPHQSLTSWLLHIDSATQFLPTSVFQIHCNLKNQSFLLVFFNYTFWLQLFTDALNNQALSKSSIKLQAESLILASVMDFKIILFYSVSWEHTESNTVYCNFLICMFLCGEYGTKVNIQICNT